MGEAEEEQVWEEEPSAEAYRAPYAWRPLDAIQLDFVNKRFTLQTHDRMGRTGEFVVVVTATAVMVILAVVLCRGYSAGPGATVAAVTAAVLGTPTVGWFWHRRRTA
ncbi:hypothetical protein AB0M47_36640 [Hamadaea sp. NPDC051192]|uniref:hypothetical protein n=1 Tax=Hamadaea sp. NPDC051192 TaxID=3154940 RepID=UPI0034346447